MGVPPSPGRSPQTSCLRRLLIAFASLLGVFLLVFYVFPPSSWLIPSAPMVEGSSGMLMIGTPEIEPRWWWLAWRGGFAVPALKAALREGNPYARAGAARLLGARKDPRLLPDLEAALVAGGDERGQYAIAQAICQTGGPQAFEVLERVARGMSTSRQMAVWALGDSKDPRAVPLLLEEFKRERRSGNKPRRSGSDGLTAARALGSICGDGIALQARTWFAEGTISRDELSALMTMTEHFDGSVMVPLLSERLRAATDPQERLGCIHDLGYKGGPDAVPVLLESLAPSPDRGSKERLEVVEMLLRINSRSAGPGLLEFAVRAFGREQEDSMRALGFLEEERAIPWLLKMQKEGTGRWTKQEAALALSRILHVDLGLPANALANEINLAKHGPLVEKAAEDYLAAHPAK
jgi:HEAT repeat protein